MKKTRLNKLFLTVLLVATISLLATMFFVEEAYANPSYEDFTSYTETDPNSHITVTNSTHIDGDYFLNEDAYVYQDKGLHFTGDFTHEIDFYWDSVGVAVSHKAVVWALSNDVDDWKGLKDASKTFLSLYGERDGSGNEELYLNEVYTGTSYTDISVDLNENVWLYLVIERSSTTFTCKIYSSNALRNAGGSADVDTLTLTLHSTPTFQYVFAGMTANDGTAGSILAFELRNWDMGYSYEYTFYGLYNEVTGERDGSVQVTAYFSEGYYANNFTVDGTYVFGHAQKPLYFRFDLVNDREYWVADNEDTASIYIFNATTNIYTITFVDLTGQLSTYSYVSARRQVNNTIYTIEKRMATIEDKVVMSLELNGYYTIYLQDTVSYNFGDILMTADTSITLTLKGLEFPKETLLTYKNVRIYGLRAFDDPTGNITITYEDLLEETTSVDIYINYKNGTNVYNATETADSFVHTWASAGNDTDYAVVCDIDHQRYGEYTWRQYFPRTFSEMPWGLGFLGTLPFNTAYILPAFLILFVGGCFTVINAQLGAFATVVTACILAYIGWLPIPSALLIVAFTMAILMALIYAKRRVTIG